MNNNNSNRSSIAILQNKSFRPLRLTLNKNSQRSIDENPNISIMSKIQSNSAKNNTTFMSIHSFNEIFANSDLTEKHTFLRKDLLDSRIFPKNQTTEKTDNPFVTSNSKMPKIVAITPSKRKRNNRKPVLRPSCRKLLPVSTDQDYIFSTDYTKSIN